MFSFLVFSWSCNPHWKNWWIPCSSCTFLPSCDEACRRDSETCGRSLWTRLGCRWILCKFFLLLSPTNPSLFQEIEKELIKKFEVMMNRQTDTTDYQAVSFLTSPFQHLSFLFSPSMISSKWKKTENSRWLNWRLKSMNGFRYNCFVFSILFDIFYYINKYLLFYVVILVLRWHIRQRLLGWFCRWVLIRKRVC